MGFITRNLFQDITYWAPDGIQTNDFGHPVNIAPVLIKGRWEDKAQQVRRPNGEEITSMAEVMVDTDVSIGGYLALGDHTTEGAPIEEASEIQMTATTPDLRNLEYERRAFL